MRKRVLINVNFDRKHKKQAKVVGETRNPFLVITPAYLNGFDGKLYSLTHIYSGYKFGFFKSRRSAELVAAASMHLPIWRFKTPEVVVRRARLLPPSIRQWLGAITHVNHTEAL